MSGVWWDEVVGFFGSAGRRPKDGRELERVAAALHWSELAAIMADLPNVDRSTRRPAPGAGDASLLARELMEFSAGHSKLARSDG